MNVTKRLSICTLKLKTSFRFIHKRWFPDAEFMKQFDGPVMYPDEITSKFKIPPANGKVPLLERKVRNMVINFGPAHPAAHGCLRMMAHLDGEVLVKLSNAFIKILFEDCPLSGSSYWSFT